MVDGTVLAGTGIRIGVRLLSCREADFCIARSVGVFCSPAFIGYYGVPYGYGRFGYARGHVYGVGASVSGYRSVGGGFHSAGGGGFHGGGGGGHR